MIAESQTVMQRHGLMDKEEACEYLNTTVQSFNRNFSKQIKPFKKIGVKNYYRQKDLDAWFKKRMKSPDSAKVKEVSENQN